jgi:hypothetical protein
MGWIKIDAARKIEEMLVPLSLSDFAARIAPFIFGLFGGVLHGKVDGKEHDLSSAAS